jgi:hypothetical protein
MLMKLTTNRFQKHELNIPPTFTINFDDVKNHKNKVCPKGHFTQINFFASHKVQH